MDITIRNIDDSVVEAINAQAGAAGQSREAYLRRRLEEIATEEPIAFKPRWGQGLKAFTPRGGKATLRQLEGVQGGASNLTQEEMDAYERAKLLADPRNGGRWAEARQILEEAGFEVFLV